MAQHDKRKSSRQAVLVMGMHRSGTSALSGILGKLGVQPPRTLMPPSGDNPRGYWESTKLMGFHDAILRSAGSKWSDWDAFNPGWIESSIADTFRDRLPELIAEEFGDAPLFLVKDPRVSRFAEFWLDALPPLSIVPKAVICVRHPSEVALSLEARNDFGRKRAQLIWLRHMLDAEHATRGVVRSFVHYGALLQNWGAQVNRIGKELGIRWPRWSSDVEVGIDRFLTSSLRRNVADFSGMADDSELGKWIATSYRVLLELSEGREPSNESLAQLDLVRRAFDETSAIYGGAVREQELQAERVAASGRDVAGERDAAQAARDQLEARLNERLQELAHLSWLFLRQESQGDSLHGRLSETEAAHEATREQHLLAQEALEALKARFDDAITRHERQVEELQTELAATLQARDAAHSQAMAAIQHAGEISLNDAVARHEACLEDLRTKHEQAMAELRMAGKTRFEEARNAHGHQLAELRAEHAVVIAALKRTVVEKQQELDLIQERMDKAVATRESRLHTQARKHAGELAEMAATHARELTMIAEHNASQEVRNREQAAIHRGHIDALQRELQLHRDSLRRLSSELQAIRNSRAWRLTAVLRGERRTQSSQQAAALPLHEQATIIRDSGWFDAAWYLSGNPDVLASGMDPILHYLEHGAREGRRPAPDFDADEYMRRHPRLAETGTNPMLHLAITRAAAVGTGNSEKGTREAKLP